MSPKVNGSLAKFGVQARCRRRHLPSGSKADLANWSAAATFEGEFSNVTSSYAGKGVARYAW
jgi:hypothetical protein